MRIKRLIGLAALTVAAALTIPGATPASAGGSGAGGEVVIPNFFPAFRDRGAVIEIGSSMDDGTTCIVWQAESTGGLYIFDGLERFEVGDEFAVTGNLCLTCLVYSFCDQPVLPLLNVSFGPSGPIGPAPQSAATSGL